MKTKKIVIHRDVNHKKGYLYLPQRNKTIPLNPNTWKRISQRLFQNKILSKILSKILRRTLTPWNHV